MIVSLERLFDIATIPLGLSPFGGLSNVFDLCKPIRLQEIIYPVLFVAPTDKTAAMLMTHTISMGFELFSYASTFFCRNKFTSLLATWVKTFYRKHCTTNHVTS